MCMLFRGGHGAVPFTST
ncbi:BnaC02g08950D [Brassica napus]|uniref:BnaC02g08950D protein n=1 Tax=Brassica napus TaxID=3708 RepID=A0A078HY69_BRANA|nr:BnaC02g08950D [Brassica napus]